MMKSKNSPKKRFESWADDIIPLTESSKKIVSMLEELVSSEL